MRQLILILIMCTSVQGGIEKLIIIGFRGDIDGSGSINISDPIMLSNFLFNGEPSPPTCAETWDANSNGGVDISDSIFLLNYLFNGRPAPIGMVECP